MSNYDWVTDEMFDEALRAMVAEMSSWSVLDIPGVYELVREELNNDVLALLDEQREEAAEGDDE